MQDIIWATLRSYSISKRLTQILQDIRGKSKAAIKIEKDLLEIVSAFINGVRTIRRRTIRRGQFGADNSAQDNLAPTIRRNNSSRTIRRKVYIINVIENFASSQQYFLTSRIHFSNIFHQICFHFNNILSSIQIPFWQYFSSIQLPFQHYFHQSRFHVNNTFSSIQLPFQQYFSPIPLPF